jgi:cytochrome b561
MSVIADDAMVPGSSAPARRSALRAYRTPAKVLHWVTVGLVFFMVASGISATHLGEGALADVLFGLHKFTGAVTLIVVLVRVGYKLTRSLPPPAIKFASRPVLHWTLYGALILLPLLGWAGVSDHNSRELLFGYALPPILPENTGFGDMLLHLHAYVAFALLALVALHIGAAMHDCMISEPEPGADD